MITLFLTVPQAAIFGLMGLIVATVIGFFIGRMFAGSDKKWQTDFEAKDAEYKQLNKDFKNQKKHINQYREEAVKWEDEYKKLESNQANLLEEAASQKEQTQLVTVERDKLKNSFGQIETKYERVEKELNSLKQKTKTEKKDSKEWRNEISRWQSAATDFKAKHERSEKKLEQVSASLTNQKKLEEQLKEMNILNKSNKHLIKKLNQDVGYWEKMHYDTHHELATKKQELEDFNKKSELLHQEKNGINLEKQNLLKMVEEYKDKFIKSNNQYRSLLEKVEKAGSSVS